MKWYKHDPDAFSAGVAGLTLEEVGAYILILDAIYSRDGNLADDDRLVSRILRCDIRTSRRLKEALIHKGKIWTSGAKLTGKRVEVTLNEARSFSEVQANFAKKRGKSKIPSSHLKNATRARTTTTTIYSGSLSEQIQPSLDLLTYEAQTRPVPKANGGERSYSAMDGALRPPPTDVPQGEAAQEATTKIPSEITRAEFEEMVLKRRSA